MNAENVSKPLNHLAERYHDMQGRAVESAKHMCDATDHFVRDNPWWTVALVAISGLVIGMLVGQVVRSE